MTLFKDEEFMKECYLIKMRKVRAVHSEYTIKGIPKNFDECLKSGI